MNKSLEAVKSDSYEVSAFNATKHGILSRYTVLPWENIECQFRSKNKTLTPINVHM